MRSIGIPFLAIASSASAFSSLVARPIASTSAALGQQGQTSSSLSMALTLYGSQVSNERGNNSYHIYICTHLCFPYA